MINYEEIAKQVVEAGIMSTNAGNKYLGADILRATFPEPGIGVSDLADSCYEAAHAIPRPEALRFIAGIIATSCNNNAIDCNKPQAEAIGEDEEEWIGEHLKEDYAECNAMGLQNGLNLTKWPEDMMERGLAQLEMITQYTQRVMDEIEAHTRTMLTPCSIPTDEKALREAAQWAYDCLSVRGQRGPMMDQLCALLAHEAPKDDK